MHLYPELVDMSLAGDGAFKRFAIDGLNSKIGWVPRDWSRTTRDTGVGNPKSANAEKGASYIEAVVPEIVDFVCDFAKKDLY